MPQTQASAGDSSRGVRRFRKAAEWRGGAMQKLKGAVVSEKEFMCTTLQDAARILNVIGLLADVYRRPEPIRFLALLERRLANRLRVLKTREGDSTA